MQFYILNKMEAYCDNLIIDFNSTIHVGDAAFRDSTHEYSWLAICTWNSTFHNVN